MKKVFNLLLIAVFPTVFLTFLLASSQSYAEDLQIVPDANVLTLNACNSDLTSKSVASAFAQVVGFGQVRDYLNIQKSKKLIFCGEGLTLDKPTSQTVLNLLQINFYNESDVLIKKLPILFENTTVQGHHNVKKRPWVVLNGSELENLLSNQVEAQLNFEEIEAKSLKDVLEIYSEKSEAHKQHSLMALGEDDFFQYYYMSWMKRVGGNGASIFSQYYASHGKLVKLNKSTKKYEISRRHSLFNFKGSLFDNLKSQSIKYLDKSLPKQVEKIEELTYLVDYK